MVQRKAEPRHYFAAAAVSNGIVWTLTLFMLMIKKHISSQVFLIIHITSCTISGILVGYLTSRQSSEKHLKIGFTTGLVSSLFYIAVSRVMFGTFETNIWTLIGLLFGGIVGGALWKMKVEKMRLFHSI